jgi:Ser/Thr protein kinase RdoA (MazF antagonist)
VTVPHLAPDHGHVVHGMGIEPVAADWPPLSPGEADALLRRYPDLGGAAKLVWHSPRPLSVAALVKSVRGGTVFVKRHHVSVRTVGSLAEEHRFIEHLSARSSDVGVGVVEVYRDRSGASAVSGSLLGTGPWTYEVHTVGSGDDDYQDAISWSPFTRVEHAEAAGRALARLHEAARGYAAAPRAAQPLSGGLSVFGAADPVRRVERWAADRPPLAAALAERPWRDDLERLHLPYHERLFPLLGRLEPLWTHNDFHASNLLWRGGEVSCVIDFGLADRAYAVHDLATAIERNAVEWLELDTKGVRAVHEDAALALVAGYESVRALSPAERRALPDLLPLCHADLALSEIDYFHGVTRNPANTELAYRYLVEHTAWFATLEGTRLLAALR